MKLTDMFGPKYTIRSKDDRTEMKFWFRSSYERELARIERNERLEEAKANGNYHRIAVESYDELLIVKNKLFEIGATIVGENGYRLEYISPVFIKIKRDYSDNSAEHYKIKLSVVGHPSDLEKLHHGQTV